MPSLDKLVSVDISLTGSAFLPASYSRILVGYASTKALDTSPQIIGSAAEFASITSVDVTSAAYLGVVALFQQDKHPATIVVQPFTPDTTNSSTPAGTGFITALQANASALRALGGYYGVLFPTDAVADKKAVADFCETAKKLFVCVDLSGDSLSLTTGTDLAGYIAGKKYEYTAVLATSTALGGTESAAFTWMGQNFYYPAGEENWALTQLQGIVPTLLTDTQRTLVLGKNANTFEPYGADGGVATSGSDIISLTYKGTVGSGNYIDEIRGRDWLCDAVRAAACNCLLTRPKLPNSDASRSVIKNAIMSVLESAMLRGFLDTPTTDGTTVTPSYTVTVPKRVDSSEADMQLRHLNGITFTAVLASAIDRIGDDDTTGIVGTLVYNLAQ